VTRFGDSKLNVREFKCQYSFTHRLPGMFSPFPAVYEASLFPRFGATRQPRRAPPVSRFPRSTPRAVPWHSTARGASRRSPLFADHRAYRESPQRSQPKKKKQSHPRRYPDCKKKNVSLVWAIIRRNVVNGKHLPPTEAKQSTPLVPLSRRLHSRRAVSGVRFAPRVAPLVALSAQSSQRASHTRL